ncbi:hypothetical protein GMLC_10500 [Geomonas limicola]|uniref:PBS lyase n=2 Tax=Geomonas limicola TaxID=2740186 RepID=A0A6V8N4V4_9BACT|nr:hypothetical protein GMLC_10500 [Geomonas limicola]
MVFFSGAQAAAAMNLTEVLDIYLKMFQGDLPDDYNSRLSAAINCLGKLGDKRAVTFLQRCADSAYWGTKVEAAQALLALGDASGWDLLEQALGDRDRDWVYYCRAGIARAVAESGDPRAVDLLLKVLETIDVDYECDAQLLEALIECLAEIGDPRSEEPIRKWQHYEFEDRDGLVEEALTKLEGRDVVPSR